MLNNTNSSNKISQAIILLGGKGTRLWPLTCNIPKPAININGIPYIIILLKYLHSFGIDTVFLASGYLSDQIIKIINKYKLDKILTIYNIKEEIPLGTGGALQNVIYQYEEKLNKNILICNSDIIYDFNLKEIMEFHINNNADLSIVTIYNENPSAFGIVLSNNNKEIINFIEKPSLETLDEIDKSNYYINTGMYITQSRKILSIFKSHFQKITNISLEKQVFPIMSQESMKLYSYQYSDKISNWLDIGTPQNLINASLNFIHTTHNHFLKDLILKENLYISKGNIINSIIYNPEYIHNSTRITNSIIMPNTYIDTQCNISNSIIDTNNKIEQHNTIYNCIIGKNSIIKANNNLHNIRLSNDTLLNVRNIDKF